MQAIKIINDIATELNDTTFVTWAKADLGDFLNAAQRQICLVRPDAASTISVVQLAASETKQALPSTARRLLDVVRNMGDDGATPGKVIRSIDEETLNNFNEDWHTDTPNTVIENFVYDERTPRTFYVYPPVHALTAVHVELKLAVNPTDISDFDNDAITIDDIYEGPIRHWMLHLAYGKETDSSESRSLSAMHMRAFYQSLGIKSNTDIANTPSRELGGK